MWSPYFHMKGEKMKGFTLRYKGMDILFKTKATRKTKSLAKRVLQGLGLPDSEPNVAAVLYYLSPAVGQYREIGGRLDFDIQTKNSGGKGGWVSRYREKGLKEVIELD